MNQDQLIAVVGERRAGRQLEVGRGDLVPIFTPVIEPSISVAGGSLGSMTRVRIWGQHAPALQVADDQTGLDGDFLCPVRTASRCRLWSRCLRGRGRIALGIQRAARDALRSRVSKDVFFTPRGAPRGEIAGRQRDVARMLAGGRSDRRDLPARRVAGAQPWRIVGGIRR